MWNVEASGAQRQYRILQKRGVMVNADDYNGIVESYPEHPIHKVKPVLKTQTELNDYRKQVEKQDIGKKKSDMDAKVAHMQKVQFKDYYKP